MQYVLGSIVALATVALAVGAITGRVKIRSCCAPADPARDRRMRTESPGSVTGGEGTTPTRATRDTSSTRESLWLRSEHGCSSGVARENAPPGPRSHPASSGEIEKPEGVEDDQPPCLHQRVSDGRRSIGTPGRGITK